MSSKPTSSATVSITLTRKNAEDLSDGLSDILCWHRGWNAAREGMGHDDNDSMGIEAVRTMRANIKDALK